jgi:UDP-2,4-diacetamido-2,4,6-trideoxy-beta-L-altropyranose hydrolase
MFITFRVDASQEIGSGHVIRCLTFASELNKLGVTINFITRHHLGNLDKKIRDSGFEVNSLPSLAKDKSQQGLEKYGKWLGVSQLVDADETIKLLVNKQCDWLVVDHYALDNIWEERLRPYAKKIMIIDDLANRKHNCDLLLDQNYIHDKGRYDCLLALGTIKFLGPKYALLRKCFLKNKEINVHNYSINKVFIFFGGSDLGNMTTMAIKALSQFKLKHLLVDVVIGSENPNQDALEKEIAKHSNIKLHVQVDNISELMREADIALGSGGMITWERISLGLPSIVVTVAENQVDSIKNLDQEGYLTWIGSANQVNENIIYKTLLSYIKNTDKIIGQRRKCLEFFDGKGAQIVAKFLTTGPDLETLSIRKAVNLDSLLYWHWANDKAVRENSLNQKTIELEKHKIWFEDRLNDPNSILLLIESDLSPIGQVRFECSNSHCVVNYSLAKQFRRFNLGVAILKKAIDYLRKDYPFTLIGKIRKENTGSKKVFERLGFAKIENKKKNDINYFELQLIPTKNII